MLRTLRAYWRAGRRARRRFAVTALSAGLPLAVVLALSFWALFEPVSSQTHDDQLRCKYAQQQQHGAKAPSYPVLLCESGRAEGEEYPAYAAVKRGEADALAPAFRHWLKGIVRDPVTLFTGLLAFSTIFLWLSTRRLWRGAEAQARDFKRSIEEASRSALAMEGVDASMKVNAAEIVKTVTINREIAKRQKQLGEMQLRAYLSVIIGGGSYQDRPTNFKFEGRPLIINSGSTSAREVSWTRNAEILPIPPPPGFVFKDGTVDAGGSIPPHQNVSLSMVVSDWIDDAEVADVRSGRAKALYIWGIIRYKDVFGAKHWTRYGQILVFPPNGKVEGYYIQGQNDTD